MKPGRDPWVPVRSESELRAGMAVQLRPCRYCGERDFMVIGEPRPLPTDAMLLDTDGSWRSVGDGATTDWPVYGRTCRSSIGRSGKVDVLTRAIRERRLYRLSDEVMTETATVREMELTK
jgi:hypothetical protein